MSELSFLASQNIHCGKKSPVRFIGCDECRLIIRYYEIYEKQEKISQIIETTKITLQIKLDELCDSIVGNSQYYNFNPNTLTARCRHIQTNISQLNLEILMSATYKIVDLVMSVSAIKTHIRHVLPFDEYHNFIKLTSNIQDILLENLDYTLLNNLSKCELTERLLILAG